MNLDFERATENIIPSDVLDRIRNYDNVVIFGAGESGDWVFHLLRKHGIFPKAFCDNYSGKWGKKRNQLTIESFQKTMDTYPDAAICVASVWSEDILKQIESYDKELLKRTWDILPTMTWETSTGAFVSEEGQYIWDHLSDFEKLYHDFKDEISKNTLEGLLNYRLTRDKGFLKAIKSKEESYVDSTIMNANLLKRIEDGILIDGGAFDGDTVDLFIKVWGKEKKLDIHCYEPDKDNCRMIEEKMQKWNGHQITVHNAALWRSSGTDAFLRGSGLSGKIGESSAGCDRVKTETIDSGNYEKVGLIKLDIEGAEREALKGGIKTIKRCRPVLIVCAYHLQDDLLVLSDFIKSLKCGYSIVLRHYMCSSGDTIMYAIPRED